MGQRQSGRMQVACLRGVLDGVTQQRYRVGVPTGITAKQARIIRIQAL